MSVYFHANFSFNRERLAGLLKYIIEEPNLNDNEIGKVFGYKAAYAQRNRSWLKKCGIIKNSIKVELTDYGRIIYEKDSKLKNTPTLWYMYKSLISSEENAESWNYFHFTYLMKNESFTKLDVSKALSMKLMKHNPNHFRESAPMIKTITRVLLDSYISKDAFGPLNLIKLKNGVYHKGKIDIPNNINIKDFDKLY